MKLSSIKLINFKNYYDESFHFDADIISIVGNNGMGKTNLLDAIYYSCMGKSYFHSSDKMNVMHQQEFLRIETQYKNENEEPIHINIKVRPSSVKEVEVNGKKVNKISDHVGLVPIVMICPDDIYSLLKGNEEKRLFVNNTIVQYDKNYLEHLGHYNKLLKQRNALIKDFGEREYIDHDLIQVITENMAHSANYIHQKRKELFECWSKMLSNCYLEISKNQEVCTINYTSQLDQNEFVSMSMNQLRSDISIGRSMVGIHRDAIQFLMNDNLLQDFGSQGQLKSYILSLKLAQYQVIKKWTNKNPIFLLDDIFDKLDNSRVKNLLHLLIEQDIKQVIITTTDHGRVGELLEDRRSEEFIIEMGRVKV